jgi:hypothetical protein
MEKTIYSSINRILLSVILIFSFSISSIAQGTMVTGGTTLKVVSGTTVTETVALTMESGAAVNNSGTIVLKGNLDDQNTTPTNLGNGTFDFAGTSAQTITGQNIMNNVIVENAAGLVIGGNTEIDGQLTLTSGLVTLGSNNLLLGPLASIIGTPTALNMIVPTGTGLLQKQFTDGTGVARNFTFPVGDNTVTAEYSPVTLNFTTGTFASGITGVNLVNSAYTGMTGSYLKRYWNVTQSGISAFSCNAQFNYVAADVTGTEANIYGIRVSPNLATYSAANTGSHYLTTNALTSFGTFTGGLGAMQTGSLTAFLQGPYNLTNHNMNTTLTTLPLGTRSDNTKFPTNQPYNGTPWNYAGTESVASLPANTVDWVLVELRHASTPANATSGTVIGRRAGFLLQNGSIVDLDGTALKFSNVGSFSDNLYIVVYHRNHMAIMAANAVTKDANQVYNYNYSSGSTQVYGGISGSKQVDASPVVWATISGDANADNHIWSNDNDIYVSQYFLSGRYISSDFNMDKNVWSNDYDLFVSNYFLSNILP